MFDKQTDIRTKSNSYKTLTSVAAILALTATLGYSPVLVMAFVEFDTGMIPTLLIYFAFMAVAWLCWKVRFRWANDR